MSLLATVLLHFVSMLRRVASSFVHRYTSISSHSSGRIPKSSKFLLLIISTVKKCVPKSPVPLMICHCVALSPFIAKLYLYIMHSISTSLTPFPSWTYFTIWLLPHRSTETTLIKLSDNVCVVTANENSQCLCYLTHQVASDTADLSLLPEEASRAPFSLNPPPTFLTTSSQSL